MNAVVFLRESIKKKKKAPIKKMYTTNFLYYLKIKIQKSDDMETHTFTELSSFFVISTYVPDE